MRDWPRFLSAVALATVLLFMLFVLDFQFGFEHVFQISVLPNVDIKSLDNVPSDPAVVSTAIKFMDRLKLVYAKKKMLAHWGHRGHPWILKNKGLLLGGKIETGKDQGHFVVVIQNTNQQHCIAKDFHIWVRITGTEIIAGTALSDTDSCRWTFPFQVHQAGDFSIESKLISYLGQSDVEYGSCNVQESETLPKLLSNWSPTPFKGFKFYAAETQCCDVCSKREDCTHWLTGGGINAHCHFFNLNNKSSHKETISETYSGDLVWGVSRPYAGSIFLGCGWSYELASEHPCVDDADDDRIPFVEDTLQVSNVVVNSKVTTNHICTLDHRVKGRWVDVRGDSSFQCSEFKMDREFSKKFPVQTFSETDEGTCWFRDDVKSISIKCLEGDCNSLKKASQWRNSSVIKKLKNDYYWGTWVPYEDCRYHLLSKKEMQKCITKKKIAKLSTVGSSISSFLEMYVKQRNQNITFYAGLDAVEVEINTLKMPHLIWHDSYATIKHTLERYPAASARKLKYYLSGMYISSEREAHVLDDRSVIVTDTISTSVLKTKGWREVYWHDVSAGFTFESATQGDGLHIVGNPMKQVWTMVMNDICRDVLQ